GRSRHGDSRPDEDPRTVPDAAPVLAGVRARRDSPEPGAPDSSDPGARCGRGHTAHGAGAPPRPAAPPITAPTPPGASVALDAAPSHWFEGAPDGTPLDIATLRD